MANRVLVNGVFDVFHSGHKLLLENAIRITGNKGKLLVAINSDKSFAKLKGEERFLISDNEEIRNSLIFNFVRNYIEKISIDHGIKIDLDFDVVSFDSEKELIGIIKGGNFDFIVKGKDTKYKKITGSNLVKAVLYVDHGSNSIHAKDLREKEQEGKNNDNK